jgi:hypothetical protein
MKRSRILQGLFHAHELANAGQPCCPRCSLPAVIPTPMQLRPARAARVGSLVLAWLLGGVCGNNSECEVSSGLLEGTMW